MLNFTGDGYIIVRRCNFTLELTGAAAVAGDTVVGGNAYICRWKQSEDVGVLQLVQGAQREHMREGVTYFVTGQTAML